MQDEHSVCTSTIEHLKRHVQDLKDHIAMSRSQFASFKKVADSHTKQVRKLRTEAALLKAQMP